MRVLSDGFCQLQQYLKSIDGESLEPSANYQQLASKRR